VNTIVFGVSIPVSVAGEAVTAASRRIAAVWLVRSGKAGKLAERARPVVREIGEVYGPPLAETFARYERGRVVFAQAAVPPAAVLTLAERIARVLAFCVSPVLAEGIARELGAPGSLRDRTRLVRAELRGCGAFVEVSRGRWMLGEPGSGQLAPPRWSITWTVCTRTPAARRRDGYRSTARCCPVFRPSTLSSTS
jgi:hypothetical protein